MSDLKDYMLESQCVHFVQAGLILGVKNEGEARTKYNEFLRKHHSNYPNCPAHVKRQCTRTCGVKVKVTQVDGKAGALKPGLTIIKADAEC